MNFKFLKVAFFSVLLLNGATALNAQNNNVVSAAVEYKKFDMAFFTGNMEEAKNVLLTSKKFIDPAMSDNSTKDSPKAHYYNAVIHFGLMMMSGIEPDNEVMKEFQSDATREMVEKSFKVAHNDKKFKREVEDYINRWVGMLNTQAVAAFEAKNYEMAFAGFAGAYSMKKMIDIEDQDFLTNSIISGKNAVSVMKKDGKIKEALEFVESSGQILPDNIDLAVEGVNLALELKDYEKADKFFESAAKANPSDKTLFASMGRIYLSAADTKKTELLAMDLYNPEYATLTSTVSELYNRAEKYLKRSLEIDPTYPEAAYDLGVLYLGQGETLRERVRVMDYDDPNREELDKKSEEFYTMAAEPLEIYFKQDPKNGAVARVLFQVYTKAGNSAKALEYKKIAESLAE
jgi:tetratricopeptide (TPR) repeat protein